MGEACSKLLKTKKKRNVIAILMSTVYRYLPAKIKLLRFRKNKIADYPLYRKITRDN